jgi:two-component system phosphate regulon sensor histidine kinase PhoR
LDLLVDRLGAAVNMRVTFIGKDGAVLGDSSIPLPDIARMEDHASRPEVKQALESGVGMNIRYSATLNMDMMYVAVPFVRQGVIQGVIRLSMPVDRLTGLESVAGQTTLLVSGLGIILGVFLSYAIARAIKRPIRQVAGLMRRIAGGDMSISIDATDHQEWKEMFDALNEMAIQSRKRFQQITEEKAQLEAVLSGMAEGVMVTDARGRIILVNPSFKGMMKTDTGCIGKSPIEVIRNAELQEMVDRTLTRQAALNPDAVFDIILHLDEGAFQAHLTPVRIEQGYYGVVAVFHDITELRRLEQVRRDFVANVSHELRTPLTSIKGYTETLLEGAIEDSDAAQRFLNSIHRQVNRLQALVEDLLQLSRIESGRLDVRIRPCDLKKIAMRVVEAFEERINRKHLRMSCDFPDAPFVRADEELIELALFNLVDNAVKYTPEKKRIDLSLVPGEDEVILCVADTGLGIPTEAQSRIFERFYRVDRGRSRDQGGTGLGLSIVRHTMEMLRGRVWVESTVGSGSKFYIALLVWREEDDGKTDGNPS